MISFPSIVKVGYAAWTPGPDIVTLPIHIIAVEAKKRSYWNGDDPGDAAKREQAYCILHLSTGASLEVLAEPATVMSKLEDAH